LAVNFVFDCVNSGAERQREMMLHLAAGLDDFIRGHPKFQPLLEWFAPVLHTADISRTLARGPGHMDFKYRAFLS
jgi:hypothetical protein